MAMRLTRQQQQMLCNLQNVLEDLGNHIEEREFAIKQVLKKYKKNPVLKELAHEFEVALSKLSDASYLVLELVDLMEGEE